MKIFVATYEDRSGTGYQKVFKNKGLAKNWLEKQYHRDTCEDEENLFKEHCEYGAWTGKIKSFNI